MSRITKQDTNGVKPLLSTGELGYDNYPTGGDAGRVYVGTGTENIALAKKTEVIAADGKADAHIARVDNPHNVTKAQVGLANVDNTSDINKPISTATQTALDSKVSKTGVEALHSTDALRISGKTLSLYKGDGTFESVVTQDTVYTLPTATSTVKGGIEIFSDTVQTVASNTVSSTAGRTYGIQLNSAGQAVVNVPWSDTNTTYTHPNSGVTAGTYLKVTVNAQGHVTTGASLSASDIPSLDASKITSGTIDPARLPSFVDDVLEFANLAGFPTTGEPGKIYIALDTNKAYRWSGSTYVYITSGAVDSVAGKTGVVTLVKADVGLSNVDNTSDANKPISTAMQNALNTKVDTTTNQTIAGVKTFSSTISGSINGNAATATKLATARTINGVSFDGTANIVAPTNLGITAGTTAGPIVTSSTGTNATLPIASASASGVVTTGNQTIAGVKTFSSSPIVPTPTTGTQAVNKDYVDSGVGAAFIANDHRVKTALNATGEAPIYACRAWVNFNGTGTVAIRAGENVSSITDNGVGSYQVNFTTSMLDVNYVCNLSASNIWGAANQTLSIATNAASEQIPTISNIAVTSVNQNGSPGDPKYMHISIFR